MEKQLVWALILPYVADSIETISQLRPGGLNTHLLKLTMPLLCGGI